MRLRKTKTALSRDACARTPLPVAKPPLAQPTRCPAKGMPAAQQTQEEIQFIDLQNVFWRSDRTSEL
jgi:hypothetical protein